MIAVVGDCAATNLSKGDLVLTGSVVGMVKLNYHSKDGATVEIHLEVNRIGWESLQDQTPSVTSETVILVTSPSFRYTLLKERHSWKDAAAPAPTPPTNGG